MKNYWTDNRTNSDFLVKNQRYIEILPLTKAKISCLNLHSLKLEILFKDSYFEEDSLLNIDGYSIGYLNYYSITGDKNASWTIYGLSLEDVDWCEITKPFMEVLPLVTFSFKSVTEG
jgi:hypothetical protein